ncbi:MAG: hypothetical protein NTV22_02685 [bacterium]|nr:hypothetical protein [bacterium]
MAAPSVVEWDNVKQEIDGFGASCAWVSTNQLTDAAADAFFSPTNGIGLSLLRARISPGGPLAPQAFDYAYASPGSIECMQKAIARGATVWSTPWTPKASYKDNNNVNNGGHLLTNNYQAYATELANYVKTLATSNGINLYALSLQNEPNLATTYESCQYSGQQLHDFLAVLGPTFAANGVTATKLMLPETDNCDYSYAAPSLNDTNTAQYVGLIAQHLYQGRAERLPVGAQSGLAHMANGDVGILGLRSQYEQWLDPGRPDAQLPGHLQFQCLSLLVAVGRRLRRQ